ncbi:MAG: hypothetical protein ABIK89_11485 [Planctomycetota bacterium]
MFAKILALFQVAVPWPSFADVAALTQWLVKIAPAEADLLVALLGQFKAEGEALIDLPTGVTVTLYQQADGRFAMSQDHQGLLRDAAGEYGKDGKFIEFITKLLPLLIQLLPLIIPLIDPEPEPQPKIV